ncbi:Lrp/AsnC family transcriptional regulator [Blastococcus sp. SYSU D00820]
MQRMHPLDEIDRTIVASLRADARRSFADIGREAGLSASAVKRRVDRLEAAGVITGYAARVDPRRMSEDLEALVEIYCTDRTAPTDVRGAVLAIDEVVSAFTVSGEPDAVVRVRVRGIAHLEQVVERLRRAPTIARTRTLIVLSTLVDRPS